MIIIAGEIHQWITSISGGKFEEKQDICIVSKYSPNVLSNGKGKILFYSMENW